MLEVHCVELEHTDQDKLNWPENFILAMTAVLLMHRAESMQVSASFLLFSQHCCSIVGNCVEKEVLIMALSEEKDNMYSFVEVGCRVPKYG